MKIIYKNKGGINKIIFLAFLGLILFTASCKKTTELRPLDSLSDQTAFDDKASIELAMVGVYQQAAIGTYSGGAGRGYPFGAASIEQAEMRAEDMVNLQGFYQITYQATYSTSSANNVNHYENLYNLINQANIVIDGVRKAGASGVISQASANSYEGEARFIRALAHHELVLNFSKPYADGNGSKPGVPYRDIAISSTAAFDQASKIGRGTVADVYTKIIADLNFAETNLSASSTVYSRATSGAAIALKTRVLLHKGDWAGVITEGAKLGTGSGSAFTSPVNGYKLTDKPDGPFANFSSNTESIFSIANSAAANPDVNGALASMLLPASIGGRSLVSISPNLYNASFWLAGDLRKTLLLVPEDGIYYTNKYRDPVTKTDWSPIIRYAEVLLNVAEANARNGNGPQALALLNAVRNRSVPAANVYTSAPADLLGAILNERRVEFAAEGRRWPDVHRLSLDPVYGLNGIPAKLNPGQVTAAAFANGVQITPARLTIAYTDFRFLWPFPLSEVNSNPLIKGQQNPGY